MLLIGYMITFYLACYCFDIYMTKTVLKMEGGNDKCACDSSDMTCLNIYYTTSSCSGWMWLNIKSGFNFNQVHSRPPCNNKSF